MVGVHPEEGWSKCSICVLSKWTGGKKCQQPVHSLSVKQHNFSFSDLALTAVSGSVIRRFFQFEISVAVSCGQHA